MSILATDWGAWVLLLGLKSALLLLGALGAQLLLRGSSAAVRHLVLAGAFAGALLLPLLAALVPELRVPVADRRLAEVLAPAAAVEGVRGGGAVAFAPEPGAVTIAGTVAGAEQTARTGGAAWPAPAPDAARGTAGGPLPVLDRAAAGMTPFAWLALIWALGAAFFLARLGVGLLRLRTIARAAAPAEGEPWSSLGESAAARVGLRRPVPIRLCPGDVVPMVWGIFRPVILLPAAAGSWGAERLDVVLLHELSHVRRRDPLAHLVAQLCRSIYWFNPLVWIAARRLLDERERACDDHVLRAGTDATDYAAHLLQIVRSFGMGTAYSPALAMARRSQFEGRMLAILDPALPREGVRSRPGSIVAAAMAMTVLPLAAASPIPHPQLAADAPPVAAAAGLQIAALPDSVPLQIRALAEQYAIDEALAAAIVETARAERVEVGLAALLIRMESGFDEGKVSPRGAVGLTQILPSTARSIDPAVSVDQLGDRRTNLRLGMRHLRALLDRYDGDMVTALAAYRAGPADGDRLVPQTAAELASPAPAGPPAPDATAPQRPPARPIPGSREEVARLVASIRSDGDRARYLMSALATSPSDAELLWLLAASDRIGSSAERKKVLVTAIALPHLSEAAMRELLHASWRGVRSDDDKAATLLTFVGRHGVPDGVITDFLKAASTIASPPEHARVLTAAAALRGGGDALIGGIIDAAPDVASDAERSAVLRAVAARGGLGDPLIARYQAAAATIGSEAERQRALSALRQPSAPAAAPRTNASGWTTELYGEHSDDGRSWRSTLRAREVVFRQDLSGIRSIGPGGRLELEQTGPDAHRLLIVTPQRDGTLRYQYRLNGCDCPLDADGRRWLQERVRYYHAQLKGRYQL